MYYCNEKGMPCENANERGYCNYTACIKIVAYNGPINNEELSVEKIIESMARRCEICTQPTDGPDYHLCPKCRLKLHDLLYDDPGWGRG